MPAGGSSDGCACAVMLLAAVVAVVVGDVVVVGGGDAGAGAGCSAELVKYACMARCRPRRYYWSFRSLLLCGVLSGVRVRV